MRHLEPLQRALVALAFPDRGRDVPVEGPVEVVALRQALRANKIPLLSLRPEGVARIPGLAADPAWAGELAAARAAYAHYRAEFAEISAALEAAGIGHVLMKSAGPFPYESDNFDILIPHGRRSAVDHALRPLGFVPQAHYRENWKFIHKRVRDGACRSIAHLHEEVSWGVEPFLDREGLWRRTVPSPEDPSFRVPGPEDCLQVTMAHGVYENDKLKLGDLLKVHLALERAGGTPDWDLLEETARRLRWLDGWRWILRALHDLELGLWGESRLAEPVARGQARLAPPDAVSRRVAEASRFPVPLGRRFSKGLFLRKLLRTRPVDLIPRQLAGFTRDAAETVWPLPLHPSRLLAVSGMDGAGKSTVIAELRTLCDDLELRHEVVWLRAGNSDLMQALNRGLRVLLGPLLRRATNDESREAPRQAGPAPERVIEDRRVAFLWYHLALCELWLRACLVVAWGRLRRRVVICDRYLADSLVDLAIRCGRPESVETLAARAPARWFPRPDLSLVLWVDGATAHGRKEQEFTREQMDRRSDLYAQAARVCHLSVDTTRGKEATFRAVRRAVLEVLAPGPVSG